LTSSQISENSLSNDTKTPIRLSSNYNYEKIVDDFLVNNETAYNQEYPSICSLSENKIAVAWQSNNQDGSDYGIYACVFNATTGNNITSEFRANHFTTHGQKHPSICALSNDTFAIVWYSNHESITDNNIYTRVFNATTGKSITSEFRINQYTANSQMFPSICALNDETIAVTWQGAGDGDPSGIYAVVFNTTTGKNITSEFRVNYYNADVQSNPSICALSNEIFTVAWQGAGESDPSGVYANIFNATTGKNITSEFRVNYYNADVQSNPSICALSNEIFTVAWQGIGTGDISGNGVFARSFNATTGESINSQFRVNQYTTNNQENPSIFALSENKLVVSWESYGQDGSEDGIYARTYNATTGDPLSSEFRVNHYRTGNQYNPSLCKLSNESFAVAWWGAGDIDPSPTGVYAAIFGPASSSTGTLSSDGDDDDDDDERTTIAGYDILITFSAICLIVAISVKKLKKPLK
jgi:uncharacterized protein with NRDE domain